MAKNASELQNIVDKFENRDALNFLCLYLAQPVVDGTPAQKLNFKNTADAFRKIGEQFGVKNTYVNNLRDAFDRYTGSHRVGWEQDLTGKTKEIFEKFKDWSNDDLLSISKIILKEVWLADILLGEMAKPDEDLIDSKTSLFSKIIENEVLTETKLPYLAEIICFSNTKKKSDGWFVITKSQVVSALCDLRTSSEFLGHEDYVEAEWRNLFKQLSDPVAKTIGGVQTVGLFQLLAKFIHFANSDAIRDEKRIVLDKAWITKAISMLEETMAVSNSMISESSHDRQKGGDNKLYYGAPGIGKSYKIRQETKGHLVIKTVFHPDTQNSDFVGTLKPSRTANGDVTYAFSPGPFAKVLALAVKNPTKKVFLVIDELNRAPAAAVFGELFQLLDRKEGGGSEYDLDFPSEEFREWFEIEVKAKVHSLTLPSNLSIVASMNSADQGVYPLDTAFKRRWEQEFIPIDYSTGPEREFEICFGESVNELLKWSEIGPVINRFLLEEYEVEEDRLIGPWFVSAKNNKDNTLPFGLLSYLWNDVLRHQDRELMFDKNINGDGDLLDHLKNKKTIFSAELLSWLQSTSAKHDTPE